MLRYVERNPVRAKIVEKATDYHWSSAKSHKHKKEDGLLERFYLLDEIRDWDAFLNAERGEELGIIRSHGKTGRPLGGIDFIKKFENISGRILQKRKPGPKRDN